MDSSTQFLGLMRTQEGIFIFVLVCVARAASANKWREKMHQLRRDRGRVLGWVAVESHANRSTEEANMGMAALGWFAFEFQSSLKIRAEILKY